ncbi:MAG: RsmG family class I SAM-dependent methyltransferase [Candidatus Zixiibacteriota bacterium]
MREFKTKEILSRHIEPEKLGLYLTEVEKANEKFSLFSRNLQRGDLEALVADCLVADELGLIGETPGRVVDIGSGWGLPAIPLLLATNKIDITLVERSQKKADFLALLLHKLSLSAHVHAGDIQTLPEDAKFDVIISRRVALEKKLISQIRRHANPGATIIYYGTAFPHDVFESAKVVEYSLDNSDVRTIIKSDF